MDAAALNDRLSAIRPRFLAALSQRLVEMEDARDKIVAGQDTAAALEVLKFGSHKTAGVAETLGYAELGTLASRAEAAVGRYQGSPGAPDALGVMLSAVDEFLGETALVVGPSAGA